MRSLSLDQLRALVTVVEQGSFSAAARLLNLTQPAVSQQIRELEDRMALPLVERLGKRAYATEAGEELIAHARRLLEEAEEATAAMRRHREGWLGRVRLGTSAAACVQYLPPILATLRRLHPNMDIVIEVEVTQVVADRLLANQLDIGLVTLPVDAPRLSVETVLRQEMVAIFPAGTQGVPPVVAVEDLLAHPLVFHIASSQTHALTQAWFRAAGHDPRPALELGSTEAIRGLVAAGFGAAIVPDAAQDHMAAAGLIERRPLAPPLHRELGIAMRRDKHPNRAMMLLHEALRGIAAKG